MTSPHSKEEHEISSDANTHVRAGDTKPLVEYSDELAEKFCEYLAQGMSVHRACREDGMPSPATIWRWLWKNEEFQKMYVEAKAAGSEALVEETIDIADDGTNDFMTIKKGSQEYEVLNREHFERSRLRVQARQWYVSKLKPKKYGDRLDLVSDGEKLPTPIFGGMSRAENRKNSKEWAKKPTKPSSKSNSGS